MKSFSVLALILIGRRASAQTTNPYTSIPSAPLPTSPPTAAQLISNIPACWAPCVGGAIENVCPSDDSWTCACNAYFNTSAPNLAQIAAYDTACQECSTNVGPSDGGEQDIEGLLVNICIALPGSGASYTTSATATGKTTTPTSTVSSQPTKNAAAGIAFQPWQLAIVPFAALGGLAVV